MAKQKHITTYSSDLLLITRYVKHSQLKTNHANARRYRTYRSREIIFRRKTGRFCDLRNGSPNRPIFRRTVPFSAIEDTDDD